MKKLLSAILTAAIIVSSVSALCAVRIFAENSDYTVTEYGSSATLDTGTLPSGNLLSGTPLYFRYGAADNAGVEKPNSDSGQASSFLYDGNLSQSAHSGRDGYRYYNGLNKVNDATQSATNCRFVLEMGKAYDVTAFLVAGSSNQFPITSFEIYVSDVKSSIFDTANRIVSYTRESGSSNHQYVVTLNDSVNAKFFGVKILSVDTQTVAASADYTSIYLNELGAYGTASNSVNSQSTLTKTSLITGSNPTQVLNNSSQSVSTETTSAGQSMKLWTNGRITDNVYNLREWNAAGGMTIAYDLGNYYNISEVLLSSGGDNRTYVAQWQAYASNSLDDLFNGSNCYAYVSDSSGSGTNRVINSAVFSEAVKCRYVGIKIIANDNSETSAYISEIAVYGTSDFTTEAISNITQMPGNNVIYKASQSATVNTYAKQGIQSDQTLSDRTTSGCHGSTGSVNVLYDNSITNTNRKFVNAATSDTYGYHNMQIVFDAKNEYTVNSVLVSIAGKEGTVSYIAYVGDNKDTLFKASNILAVCDNAAGAYTTLGYVSNENAKTGSVFGILITGYTTTATVYVDEIAFFEPDAVAAQASNVEAVDGKNILDGKKLYQGSGTATGTTEKTLDGYSQNVNKLTNGLLTDVANVAACGGTGLRFYNGGTANFTYDTESDVDIARILVSGGKKTSGDNTMAFGCYGVYVGSSSERSTLYDISNRVAMFINVDYSQTQSFDLSGLDISGRYVGIMMYGIYDHFRPNNDTADTAMYITEIAVYGNYSTDAYTIVNEPSEDTLSGLGSNVLSYASTEAEIDNGIITDQTVLTDDTADAIQITNANGTKITYDLGYVQDVNALLVGGVYNSASNIAPLHYRIYLAEDNSDLYTDGALTVEYYNVNYKSESGNYAGSAQLFELADAVSARYVGFEFVTAALGSTTLTLSELGAYATYNAAGQLTGSITSPVKVYLDGVLVSQSAVLPADVLYGNHSLTVYNNASSNNVYIVNDGVFTYKSELNDALAVDGVQIRTDNPLAIRFVNSIKTSAKPYTVKYGAVVAKSAAVASADLLVDSEDYTTVNGIAYEKDVSDVIFAEDEDTVQYTVAVYNIGTQHHLTYYAVRPYMVITVSDVDYTVYGETYESRPYDVAVAALADEQADYSEEVTNYLNNIVDNSSLSVVSRAFYQSLGLTDDSVEASVKNASPDNDRLIRVIQKAMRGEDITLGVLGGSITMGANVTKAERATKAYAGRLREWLENTFNVNVNLVNAGIGATTSVFGVHRIENDLLQYEPDLVVLEYAVNETASETTNKTYEDCIRRILASDDDTALILLFTVRYTDANGFYNNQAAQITIGENYDLPMISYMDCVVPLIEDEVLTWYGSTNKGSILTTDNIHPSYFGHQIIAALLSDYIANLAESVTADTVTTVSAIPAALNGATYTNATFYNCCTLPQEWITSMGSFEAAHDIYDEYIDYECLTNGWKSYSTGSGEAMVLNIPGAKTVTMLMVRTKDIANGIYATVTVTNSDGTATSKTVSNYLNSSNYADTSVIYTANAGDDITVEITPSFGGLDGEIVILGIMVGFDEA